VVTNPAAIGTPAANVTIAFTQDDGTAWNLPFQDQDGNPVGSGNTINVQLSGGQTRFYQSDSFFANIKPAILTGYATVTSSLPVTAAGVFQEFNQATGTRIASAGVPPSTALTSQTIIYSVGGKSDTGVAFVNPGGSTANATLTLVGTGGVVLFPPVNVAIPAHQHFAKFVSQMFPNSHNTQGTMLIQTSSQVATIPLYFNADSTFFTAPVIPIAP
jgi:hypothetical protein